MVISVLLILVVSYLLGNINGAIWISKSVVHDDVRTHGSGNAGFTNFFRNYGGLNSLLVLAIDFCKAAIACLLGGWLLGRYGYRMEGMMAAALAVTLGHDFPALCGFKGGKGILCGLAVAVCLDWRIAVVIFILFFAAYLPTRYVSLGSVVGACGFGLGFILFHHDNWILMLGGIALSGLAIFMHRANIKRLIRKEESKTDFFKRKSKE